MTKDISQSATPEAQQAIEILASLPQTAQRLLVAIVGPPASGKSTISDSIAEGLTAKGHNAVVVPMDGFHLDNRILINRDLLHRKGAPQTFDAGGLERLLDALRSKDDVYFPIFDRTADLAAAGAGVVPGTCDIVLVEGNYLLLDQAPWDRIAGKWDYSISLDVNFEILRERLIARWTDHGLNETDAIARAEQNDIPNAKLVVDQSRKADLTIRNQ